MYQELSKEKKKVAWMGATALALFWVVFLWNFWERGIFALGINAAVFMAGMMALFFWVTGESPKKKENLFWLVPMAMIALSYLLYENPFLKMVNFLVVPLSMAIFASATLSPMPSRWSTQYVFGLFFGRLRFLLKFKEVIASLGSALPASRKPNVQLLTRIFIGIGLLLLVSFFVVIPLLSSADPMFAKQLGVIADWVEKLINFQYLNRVIFFLFFAFVLSLIYFSLERKNDAGQKEERMVRLDSVVAGIVLSGVLALYLLFLYTQLKYLWIDILPIEFKDTERLVKSGFWQLFFLSLINIVFFLTYFRRTNALVQNILKAFTVASFLLLASAGQRMFLYVTNYGLSYEKFFASYTVAYCAVLFVWLFAKLFSSRPADPVRFIIFSLFWMYGIVTILPVERIVFSSNVKLSQRSGSRIKLNELTMLSNDVLPMVVDYRSDDKWLTDWCWWYGRQKNFLQEKKWFEKNLSCLDQPESTANREAFDSCRARQEELNRMKEGSR